MPQAPNPVLTRVYRGSELEAAHRGAYAVVSERGLVRSAGDVEAPRYPRSALKPFQVLPLFAGDGAQRLGLTAEEVAVLVASHSGGEAHVAAVRSALAKGEVPEQALGCGAVAPLGAVEARELFARGGVPARIHHNCSGKHAGFLLAARQRGAPLESYLDPEHPVQVEIRALLARLTGSPAGDIPCGNDGCGAPCFALSVRAVAELFRDLAAPERLPEAYRAAARRIFDAMSAAPEFVAGPGRFDTALLEAGRGGLVAKGGAEGFHALGVRARGARPALGVAVKVDDGNPRGYQTFVARLLVDLGALAGNEAPLRPYLEGALRNSRGERVGVVHTDADADAAGRAADRASARAGRRRGGTAPCSG